VDFMMGLHPFVYMAYTKDDHTSIGLQKPT
jgi:hypothetical protein